ncbi:hypothetical protein CK501_08315 [Halovibrio salipaludis]|uniref:Uncharacterized protein n=1 Tax=Halovibrio salipaludis TaxID=2032626 RepID=A0A2A2F4C4_9GAMM|nr:hypothetical protein CK501_08315 [Halovibrio salipaludis]
MKSLVFRLLVGFLETLYMVVGGVATLFVFMALNSGALGLPASPWLGGLGALITMAFSMMPGYFILRRQSSP